MDHRRLARVHGALANEIRLRILELVSARNEMCVCELVDELHLSQANISRHVSVLRDAGLVLDRKVGTWVLLRVDEVAMEESFRTLLDTLRRHLRQSRHEDAVGRLRERCPAEQLA